MTGRLLFVAIALFWVVMNFLLWRAEFGGGEAADDLPIGTVIERVLDAADHSVLRLRHHGRPLGQLRWTPSILEGSADTNFAAALPEGMVRASLGHALDIDLNLFGDEPSSRWRVTGHVELDPAHAWTAFNLRLLQRPASWEFSAKAGEDDVRLRFEEGKTSWEQKFSARDLANPAALLAGPYAALLPRGLFPATPLPGAQQVRLGLNWTARNDWLRVGKNRVRVYRVRAKLFDRYEAVAYLSRAGEVLKVELPDNLVLVNEALPGLGKE